MKMGSRKTNNLIKIETNFFFNNNILLRVRTKAGKNPFSNKVETFGNIVKNILNNEEFYTFIG